MIIRPRGQAPKGLLSDRVMEQVIEQLVVGRTLHHSRDLVVWELSEHIKPRLNYLRLVVDMIFLVDEEVDDLHLYHTTISSR